MKLILMLSAALMATAAAAQDAPAPTAQPVVAAKPKLVCHTEDTIGSRLGGHKECHTAAEWAKISRDQGDDLNRRTTGVHNEMGG
jgi:hypothetical protein